VTGGWGEDVEIFRLGVEGGGGGGAVKRTKGRINTALVRKRKKKIANPGYEM